jgi:hypothetical protein
MAVNAASPSHHRELYRYWRGKRGGRAIPTRRDIDPTEIARLLPYVALIEADRDGYRWRLMGTAIAADLGRDLTGERFGRYIAPSPFAIHMTGTFDRVLADGTPIFEESLYWTGFRMVQAVSRLLLPLAPQGGTPGMVLLTRIPRDGGKNGRRDPLNGAAGQLCGTFRIDSAEDLEERVAAWEQRVAEAFAPARLVPEPLYRIANIWGGGPPHLLRCIGEPAEVVRLR